VFREHLTVLRCPEYLTHLELRQDPQGQKHLASLLYQVRLEHLQDLLILEFLQLLAHRHYRTRQVFLERHWVQWYPVRQQHLEGRMVQWNPPDRSGPPFRTRQFDPDCQPHQEIRQDLRLRVFQKDPAFPYYLANPESQVFQQLLQHLATLQHQWPRPVHLHRQVRLLQTCPEFRTHPQGREILHFLTTQLNRLTRDYQEHHWLQYFLRIRVYQPHPITLECPVYRMHQELLSSQQAQVHLRHQAHH